MAEENDFEKSRPLKFEEVKSLVDDYLKLKVSQIPVGTYFIVKAIAAFRDETYEWKGKPTTTRLLNAEFSAKELASPVKIVVQVGESCYKRFTEKYKPEEYVGKYLLITKTSFDGAAGDPQHIHIMKGEFSVDGRPTKDDVFKTKSELDTETPKAEPTPMFDTAKDEEILMGFKASFDGIDKSNMKNSTWVGIYLKNAFPDHPIVKHALELASKL